ncbi:hypothetical protein OSCI_340034 [Kamptonema sp. PCC 6506]|nr:hypothetical protein OSCI_340034 [Kamptonema sp. PCC 6506]
MSNQDLASTIKAQLRQDSTQLKVFNLLSDQQWHCRECEGKQIASSQYAGGGGIQELQRKHEDSQFHQKPRKLLF